MPNRQEATQTDTHVIARAALAELLAPEPNRDSAALLGGDLSWDDTSVQFEAARDPANARALRPHLIAACQQLAEHPTLGIRCAPCDGALGFLGLAAFATGVIAVTNPHRQRGKYRTGGVADLTLNPGTRSGFAYAAWERALSEPSEPPVRAADMTDDGDLFAPGRVLGDRAHTRNLTCRNCGRQYRLANVELIRRYLDAVAHGDRQVLLGPIPKAQIFSP
jgi:hypothetical protein